MQLKARIGITTYGRNDLDQFMVPAPYVDAVRRAGAIAVLLPPGEDDVGAWLDLVDGVVLAGGGDMDPRHYDGPSHPTLYGMNADRDHTELALARRLVDDRVPTLGICRGAQVLNVALGGTLHAHLPDVVGERVLHRAPPREPVPHPVRVAPGSALASVLGELTVCPPSWHHQAIDRLAPGLEVVAHAEDGTIEAVEMREHPWLIAVQWHPELAAGSDPVQQRLFDALVRRAGG